MINMGTQGLVKPKDQVQAPHIYVDGLDEKMAKSWLMALYKSQPSMDQVSPLHVQVCLVLDID